MLNSKVSSKTRLKLRWFLIGLTTAILGIGIVGAIWPVFSNKYIEILSGESVKQIAEKDQNHDDTSDIDSIVQSEIDSDESSKIREVLIENPDDYSDKIKLAENNDYIVWMINVSQDTYTEGNFLIEFKRYSGNDRAIEIFGEVKLFGTAEIIADFVDRYLTVTSGTSTIHNGYVIDLERANLIATVSITSDVWDQYYYNNSIYYCNSDLEDNRPWGAGQAPSVVQLNTDNGKKRVLYQSSELEQYSIRNLKDGVLYVTKSYVQDSDNWDDNNKVLVEDMEMEL